MLRDNAVRGQLDPGDLLKQVVDLHVDGGIPRYRIATPCSQTVEQAYMQSLMSDDTSYLWYGQL